MCIKSQRAKNHYSVNKFCSIKSSTNEILIIAFIVILGRSSNIALCHDSSCFIITFSAQTTFVVSFCFCYIPSLPIDFDDDAADILCLLPLYFNLCVLDCHKNSNSFCHPRGYSIPSIIALMGQIIVRISYCKRTYE